MGSERTFDIAAQVLSKQAKAIQILFTKGFYSPGAKWNNKNIKFVSFYCSVLSVPIYYQGSELNCFNLSLDVSSCINKFAYMAYMAYMPYFNVITVSIS